MHTATSDFLTSAWTSGRIGAPPAESGDYYSGGNTPVAMCADCDQQAAVMTTNSGSVATCSRCRPRTVYGPKLRDCLF